MSNTHPDIPRPTPAAPMETRTVRVTDELWDRARELAASEGVDVSAVVRHYLQHYVDTAPAPARKKRTR